MARARAADRPRALGHARGPRARRRSARTSRTSATSGWRSGSPTPTARRPGPPHEETSGAAARVLCARGLRRAGLRRPGRPAARRRCRPCGAATGASTACSTAAPGRASTTAQGRIAVAEYDSNGDGRADYIAHYDENRQIRLIEVDEDHDSWVDRFEHYDAAGVLEKVGRCRARRAAPTSGPTARPTGGPRASSTTTTATASRSAPRCSRTASWSRLELDSDRDGRIDRWQHWEKGRLASEEIDTNGDGAADRRLVFGPGAAAAGRARAEMSAPERAATLVRVLVLLLLAAAPLLAGAVHEPVFIPLLAGSALAGLVALWRRARARRGRRCPASCSALGLIALVLFQLVPLPPPAAAGREPRLVRASTTRPRCCARSRRGSRSASARPTRCAASPSSRRSCCWRSPWCSSSARAAGAAACCAPSSTRASR